VKEAAVTGRPDPEWGELVTAFVAPNGDSVDEQELADHCRRLLAGYKVPRAFHVVSELPRNAAGKLLRRELFR
jgi:acyl-CoA synthetase (AMP-forming)/AMP-acid ligase II